MAATLKDPGLIPTQTLMYIYAGINVINHGLFPIITGLSYLESKILRFTGKITDIYSLCYEILSANFDNIGPRTT
jgi:hypothetical protein